MADWRQSGLCSQKKNSSPWGCRYKVDLNRQLLQIIHIFVPFAGIVLDIIPNPFKFGRCSNNMIVE